MGLINLFADINYTPTKPESLLLALVGVAIVFGVLCLLIGLLYLFKAVFQIKIFRDKEPKKEAPAAAESASSEDEEEIVAAIAAAISMTYECERGVVPPFKIKSIKSK